MCYAWPSKECLDMPDTILLIIKNKQWLVQNLLVMKSQLIIFLSDV